MIGAEVKAPDTDEALLERKHFLRLSGKIKNSDLLKAEIIKGNKKPDYYEHLSKSLDFLEVKDLTKTAIEYKNTDAIMALLNTNLYAATSQLATNEGAKFLSEQEKNTQGNSLINIFFMVRTAAPLKYRRIMKRLARNVILKTSLKISGRGLQKGIKRERVPYHPGMAEFDLESTLPNLLEKGKMLSYRDIVGVRRTQIKKNVILILDTSGSMYGRSLLNAALTTSVLSYVMDKHKYGVILFNSNSMILKNINEERPVISIIDQILDSEAVGFTNIEVGLKRGLKEINKINDKHKFGILITDGNYNRGDNPVEVAKKFPRLHVIGMPSEKIREFEGIRICKEIAKAGKGHFYPVSNYHEIPRSLLEILHNA